MTHLVDVVRLEIELSESPNQLANPSGQVGRSDGWSDPWLEVVSEAALGAETLPDFPGTAFRDHEPGLEPGSFRQTDKARVQPGQWIGVSVTFADAARKSNTPIQTVGVNVQATIPNSGGYSPTLLDEAIASNMNITTPAASPWASVTVSDVVEADIGTEGDCWIQILIDPSFDRDVLVYDVALVIADTESAATAALATAHTGEWINVIGSAYHIHTQRGGAYDGPMFKQKPGTLTATLTDPALDPATHPGMRPSRPVRLRIEGGETVFTGKLDRLSTSYVDGVPRISIAAVDQRVNLDSHPCPIMMAGPAAGRVAQITHGGYLATAVHIAGDDLPDIGVEIIHAEQNATAASQMQLLAGTLGGLTYTDRFGLTHLYDAAAYTEHADDQTPIYLTDRPDRPGMKYTAYEVGFSTDDVINDLAVVAKNTELENGSHTFGPWRADESAAQWGIRSGTIEITEGDPAEVAAAYLDIWSNPRKQMTSATVRLSKGGNAGPDLAYAGVELFDRVATEAADAALGDDEPVLADVIGVAHTITPHRWLADLTLARPGDVASPATVTVSPHGSADGLDVADLITGGRGVLVATRTSTQSIGDSSYVRLQYNSVDTIAGFAVVSNGLYQCAVAGRYLIIATNRWQSNDTGSRYIGVYKNGTRLRPLGQRTRSGGDWGNIIVLTVDLDVGDQIEARVYQSSGGNLNAGNAPSELSTYITAERIGRRIA